MNARRFDHLVGVHKERRRHVEAEDLRRLQSIWSAPAREDRLDCRRAGCNRRRRPPAGSARLSFQDSPDVARPRRRGDRIAGYSAAIAHTRFCHRAEVSECLLWRHLQGYTGHSSHKPKPPLLDPQETLAGLDPAAQQSFCRADVCYPSLGSPRVACPCGRAHVKAEIRTNAALISAAGIK
jgi:hypothetical protein